MNTILLVEDDEALSMGTVYSLESEGFRVLRAADTAGARSVWEDNRGEISLVLLDVMLPDGDGYQLCREWKAQCPQMPILFLTALGDEGNVVRGLDTGADDYICKPFRIQELMARIRANLRKGKRQEAATREKLVCGKITLDTADFSVFVDGVRVELTLSEFRLLWEFMKHQGQTLTRDQLMERLWAVDQAFVDNNTLSVYVRRLREKIDAPGEESCITTIRGIGYRMDRRG